MTINETDVQQLLEQTLRTSETLVLATTGPDGPWAAGTFFVAHDPWTVDLVLEQSGRTLTGIRHEPRVGVIISANTPFAPFLQAQGIAEVLDGEADEALRDALVAKVPAAEPFVRAPIVAVRLAVPQWRVTDIPNGWLPGKVLSRGA